MRARARDRKRKLKKKEKGKREKSARLVRLRAPPSTTENIILLTLLYPLHRQLDVSSHRLHAGQPKKEYNETIIIIIAIIIIIMTIIVSPLGHPQLPGCDPVLLSSDPFFFVFYYFSLPLSVALRFTLALVMRAERTEKMAKESPLSHNPYIFRTTQSQPIFLLLT